MRQSCDKPAARAVQQHSGENDRAGDQRVEIRVRLHDDEAVEDALEQHRTQHRSWEHFASSTEQTRAAERRGRNGVELVTELPAVFSE